MSETGLHRCVPKGLLLDLLLPIESWSSFCSAESRSHLNNNTTRYAIDTPATTQSPWSHQGPAFPRFGDFHDKSKNHNSQSTTLTH